MNHIGTQTFGKYQITYQNGVKQIKTLISHKAYLDIIKPTYLVIDALKTRDKNDPQIKKLELILKELFTEFWFTDESPLWSAFYSGKLILPSNQGGTTKCNLKELLV